MNYFKRIVVNKYFMKILLACEESQRVCIEFRKLGHEAYSCDIEKCSGGHPEWHIKDDVLRVLNPTYDGEACLIDFWTQDDEIHVIDKWDMIIAFPPCTYLTVAGNRWFNVEKYGYKAIERAENREKGKQFFMQFVNADCERIAIENPVGIMSTEYRKPDQIIQPWMFGDKARKATCLWLKGLPLLRAIQITDCGEIYSGGYSKNAGANWVEKDGKILRWNDPETAKIRSKTFPGVAKAMAEQWGNILNERGKKMTLENMKVIAAENNGTIPAGMAMTMTDLEVRRAIKHGYLKEDPKEDFLAGMKKKEEKVQSPEPKKTTGKGSVKASKKEVPEKTAETENNDNENVVINLPASEFSKEQKDIYRKLDGLIYDRMNDMKKSSFDIAFALHFIYENCYYKIGGFKNIYEYASKRYGIARGTTNNFINLVDRFADLKNQESFELKSEFADYSSTQLICMLGHTDDELKEKNITPSMSSRDIKKALKDSGNRSKGEDVNTLNGGGSSRKGSDKESDIENENEDKETRNESGLNELRTNVVLEITKKSFSDSYWKTAEEEAVLEILKEKVKVISKLLLSGHCIQILDILP